MRTDDATTTKVINLFKESFQNVENFDIFDKQMTAHFTIYSPSTGLSHADVLIWKRLPPWWRHQMEIFPRYWLFVRGIHRSPVNSPHKGQWRGDFMFSLICVWINGWVNNREAGDLKRYRAHYDVIVMHYWPSVTSGLSWQNTINEDIDLFSDT